jgi:hypothetical protein
MRESHGSKGLQNNDWEGKVLFFLKVTLWNSRKRNPTKGCSAAAAAATADVTGIIQILN